MCVYMCMGWGGGGGVLGWKGLCNQVDFRWNGFSLKKIRKKNINLEFSERTLDGLKKNLWPSWIYWYDFGLTAAIKTEAYPLRIITSWENTAACRCYKLFLLEPLFVLADSFFGVFAKDLESHGEQLMPDPHAAAVNQASSLYPSEINEDKKKDLFV